VHRSNGRSGWVWVPLVIVDREAAIAREDYSALELTVEPGDLLVVQREESGWAGRFAATLPAQAAGFRRQI
jgi:hypothetical protein